MLVADRERGHPHHLILLHILCCSYQSKNFRKVVVILASLIFLVGGSIYYFIKEKKPEYSLIDKKELTSQLDEFIKVSGPNFLEVKVEPGSRNDLGRPTVKPVNNKYAFMDFMKEK